MVGKLRERLNEVDVWLGNHFVEENNARAVKSLHAVSEVPN